MIKKDFKDEKYVYSRDCKSTEHSNKMIYDDEIQDEKESDYPKIEIVHINIVPNNICNIADPLELRISFCLDRYVSAAYWTIKFLVDSSDKRIIRILGDTNVEDYPEGDSEMTFHADSIDISGISPSVLTNSGLLIAEFIIGQIAFASVNMVVNVLKSKDGSIVREILNPLD